MRTQFLSFEDMDAALNRLLPESVIAEGFELPDGNGFMPILTIVKRGEPGDIITSADRYASYGEAVAGAYRIAVQRFPHIRWIVLREA